MAGVRDPFLRVHEFFASRIWKARLDELQRGRALVYRASRVIYTALRGFRDNQLTDRAAALTYYTVLSLVPLLAFAFSVLKGFGVYDRFIDKTVVPYVTGTFAQNPALLNSIKQVLTFVDQTDVGRLGTFGIVILAYAAISLLSQIEASLNELFGATTKRPLVRQVTDYTTLIVTTPILLFSGIALATAAQSSRLMLFARETLELGFVIDFFMRFASLVVVCLAMTALFIILPNVRTRLVSALIGGAVSGVLWQIALLLHVQFQSGMARYNALYSAFAAIPIFLVWIYVSWLTVLVGAQVAASHQNEQLVGQQLRARNADQALREEVAVAVVALVIRDFLAVAPRRDHVALAGALAVPPLVVDPILADLVQAGVLARSVAGDQVGYVPGRDIDECRVDDVRAAVRREAAADDVRACLERSMGPRLRAVLHGLEEAARSSPHNLTLRELAGRARELPAAEPRGTEESERVLDAKQPEVAG